MTSTGGKWLRSLLMSLVILAAPGGAAAVRAQAGFGPDPFQPYNSQYNPYVYPMGPASPGAGQSAGGTYRMGNQGANQFQGYLDELSGSGRQGTERYGIGVPYYRSSVDPSFDPKGNREYRPNSKVDRPYQQTQEVITRKYLAYFAEKDPRRRAALLRDYNRTRSQVSRAMSARREAPSRVLEAAAGEDFDHRGSPSTAGRGDGLSARARSPSGRSGRAVAADAGRRGGTGAIPPPPPLFPGAYNQRATTPRRSPSQVLDRSRRLNSRDDVKPGPDAPARARSSTVRRPAPVPPPD